MDHNGLVTSNSGNDFTTTAQRLVAAIEARGIEIFAVVDHAAGAASVGSQLRPTTLIIFGNPAAGTPLMQAAQAAGIDLPLKALIWQGSDGMVKVTYNDPSWIAARHGVAPEEGPLTAPLTAAITALVNHATQEESARP